MEPWAFMRALVVCNNDLAAGSLAEDDIGALPLPGPDEKAPSATDTGGELSRLLRRCVHLDAQLFGSVWTEPSGGQQPLSGGSDEANVCALGEVFASDFDLQV